MEDSLLTKNVKNSIANVVLRSTIGQYGEMKARLMKSIKIRIFAGFAAIGALAMAIIPCSAVAKDVIPGTVIRSTISDSEHDYKLRSATLSENGSMTEVIFAARLKGRRSESESLIWATIDASGRVLSQQNVLERLTAADAAGINLASPSAGRGLLFIRDRGFLLLPTVDGGLRMMGLTHSKEPVLVKTVNIAGHYSTVQRVLTKSNQNIVVVGSIGIKAVVNEIDTEGKIIAQRLLPGEEAKMAISAIFELDGSAVVIGEQGMFPNSTVWVERVSPAGKVLASAVFPGRPADIARGSDGTYVVLIERSTPDGSEILMKTLAPDFSERWTRSLVSRQRMAIPFRVAPVPTGGFIVTGVKDRGLWISRVNSDGTEVWTVAHEPQSSPELEMVSHVELSSIRDIFVATYTAFVVVGREQREVVRLIRFRAS